MRIKILLLGFMFMNLLAESQTIEKFSIDSGGASVSNGTMQVLFTIGEVSVQEVTVGNVTISEGFINPLIGEPTLSIVAQGLSDVITIYPNPVTDILYIQSPQKLSSIQLYDALGKLVADYKNDLGELHLGHLPNGVYLLKVITDIHQITKKIIIN
ncbi:T9SS type A sorting domain-containing protein [Psychroserpens sp. XS_ASV72]|uniref:T9SS type A sorting domain-containing protein n=1 Tax=Psychroserpens sp. XS_ASV72 TaxID=3241293 RepID=UPI0035176C7B